MGNKENTAIVVNGLNEGKSDDAILQELFENDIPFGDLRSTFNDIVKEKGLRLTAKERKDKTAEILVDVTEITTVEEVESIVANLATVLKIADTKAMGSLRTWAKEKGIDVPKAARVAKSRKIGFGGHYAKILEFILANREADKKAVIAFCHSSDIPEAYATTAMNVVHFAKVWSGEVSADVEPELEAEAA